MRPTSEWIKKQIMKRWRMGWRINEIAEKLEISTRTISRVLRSLDPEKEQQAADVYAAYGLPEDYVLNPRPRPKGIPLPADSPFAKGKLDPPKKYKGGL
jgi:transcriptional regulator with XRE-family HTH domain